jgi:hypothetical protein
MKSSGIAIPVALYRVPYETTTGRPFSTAERTVLSSVNAGISTFEAVHVDMALHPRIVAECITTLFEAGLLEFHGGESFRLTQAGTRAVGERYLFPTRQATSPWTMILVDRVTGALEFQRNIRYYRIDELPPTIRCLPPGDLDPMPGRSALRDLIEQRPGKRLEEWVRSVGKAVPQQVYNLCVLLDDISSSRWRRELASVLPDLKGRPGSREETDWGRSEEPSQSSAAGWVRMSLQNLRMVDGGPAHLGVLHDEFKKAEKYVFIHSAFATPARLEALEPVVAAAANRGIDVLLLRGIAGDGDSDSRFLAIARRLAADLRHSPGRVLIQTLPSGSHIKLLITDGRRAYIGSYNWLSAPVDSTRPEVSLSIIGSRIIDRIRDIGADLFHDGGPMWPSQLLRSISVISSGADDREHGDCLVRTVLDRENRAILFDYLRRATERLIIASDKVSPVDDPLLRQQLATCAERLANPRNITLRFSDGIASPVIAELSVRGARFESGGNNHAKFAIMDQERMLITSYNLLSFGGHSSRRTSAFELGVEIVQRAVATTREPANPWHWASSIG